MSRQTPQANVRIREIPFQAKAAESKLFDGRDRQSPRLGASQLHRPFSVVALAT